VAVVAVVFSQIVLLVKVPQLVLLLVIHAPKVHSVLVVCSHVLHVLQATPLLEQELKEVLSLIFLLVPNVPMDLHLQQLTAY
jgi:hypothetical protein